MRLEGQVVSAPIPGIAERAARNLPMPQIGKNLVLPGKMEAQTGMRIGDGVPSLREAAQKREVVRLRFRTRHLRQVHDSSVLAFYTRPVTFLFYEARGRWGFRLQNHNFTRRKVNPASLFQKGPAEGRMMSPHEFHGLVARGVNILADLQHRFTLLERHGAI